MKQVVETIIIGGGQAGLATSYFLNRHGRENIILEQAAQVAAPWRTDRWDSFTFLTPNWSFRLPGAEYDGPEPDGFMTRDEIVTRFEDYVERYRLPIRYQVRVDAVEQVSDGSGYLVRTGDSVLKAKNVVVATGLFQQPKVPALSADIPSSITQLSSGQYRNPDLLPPGAVLVVGSGQSGCQIAEELYQSGRRVYLCVGSTGRAPRRYRGKDAFAWLELCGFFSRTVDKLPSPKAKFGGNPQLTGRDGGHSLNLHQFKRDGVILLGHLVGVRDQKIQLAPDLKESLAKSDKFEADLVRIIDAYIVNHGLDSPEGTLPSLRDGYDSELIAELDLTAAGVTTVIWAMGYRFDFSLVKLPVTDSDGFPITRRGATDYPGLYFVGMPWLHTQKSGLLLGVGEDAALIASAIAGQTSAPVV